MNKKVFRRGLPFAPEVASLVGRMAAVDEYREELLRLQGAWDSLSMLGLMSGTVPDIGGTRSAFAALTGTLLDNLARRLLGNLTDRLQGRAQVAIDILVRNLFERTADVGFLATDRVLCAHAEAFHQQPQPVPEAERAEPEARFRQYVAKYSVYDDIVVLCPQGRVLARLDRGVDCGETGEPWVARTLQSTGYVEHHGPSALLGRTGLIYANAIRGSGGRPVGVLALSFRFDDEMRAVFAQLLPPGDAGAIVLIDAERRIVASSDTWQLPLGAPLAPLNGHRLRFGGRDYLAVGAPPSGYEGYSGPGWSAVALMPADAAFEDDGDAQDTAPLATLAARLDTHELFDAELLAIAPQARRIERDLARILWNGKLRRRGDTTAAFAGTLLREVGTTGERMRRVFDLATGNLHRSTLSAVFEQAREHARLAIDIADRNLYERANDCRWWALDGVLRATLSGDAEAGDASATLKHINGLYTVYSLLVLFDAQRRVVAVSDPAVADVWVGRTLDEPWAADTLTLRDEQSHAVSRHVPSALYGDRPTCVYGAALRDGHGRVAGGIGIVFDGAPQFAAMLGGALPRGTASIGLLVSRDGTVLASTDARFAVGSPAPVPPTWSTLGAGQSASAVIDLDGTAYAAGCAMSAGYREYPVARPAAGDEMGALLLTRLGARLPEAAAAPQSFEPVALRAATDDDAPVTIAGFLVDGTWLGLPAQQVVEALEPARIAALPNAPRHLLGMLPFEGRMLPLFDLGLLRGAASPASADAPIVVAQTDDGRRYALRVQALGAVFDAPPSGLQTLHARATERLVRGAGGQMLGLLDAQALWQVGAPGADLAAA